VYLNNRNQENEDIELRNGIYSVIVNDLKSDTTAVRRLIEKYEELEPEFLKVMNDSLTAEDEIFTNLLTSQRLVNLKTRGFKQLLDFKNSMTNEKDTLTFKITEFYSSADKFINETNDLISEDIIEIIKTWRDNYNWFNPLIKNQKITEEAKTYFLESLEYKNRVTYRHILVYENYVPSLKEFLRFAEVILTDIEKKLKEDN
jgi:hypothetical protein